MSAENRGHHTGNLNALSSDYATREALTGFQTYFKQYRMRCFDYSRLEENLRGVYLVPQEIGYEMIRSFCRKIGRPDLIGKCVIEYIDHNQFQAFATKDDDHYYIGISAAVPALLQALFHNLFSLTNPLTESYNEEHGTGEEEDETTYVFPDRIMSGRFTSDELRAEISGLIKDTIPKERWQRIMASKLAELATCFCIAHEIGHWVSGHIDIVETRAFHTIEEVRRKTDKTKTGQSRPIGRWLSQSFEIQADRIGMALLYSYAIGTKANRKKFMHYLRCHNDPSALYGRLLYAVYFVFLLLGQQQYMIDVQGSHPAPITRMSYLMAFLGTVMTEVEGADSTEAGDLVEQYADIAEAAWNRIGFTAGRNPDTIDDLPGVVEQLQRANAIVESIFKSQQWAVKYRPESA